MTTKPNRHTEFDKKVADLCASDPLLTIDAMADKLLVHKTTIQTSFRRQNINRIPGRRKSLVKGH